MIIPSDTSQEYFNIQPRRHKIPKANPVSPQDYANQLTEQQVQVFILFPPQGPKDHLQAQQYQPKIWNIHIDFFNHAYSDFSKTNPINYDTYQETEPNYNNSIITIQRLHLRK